MGEDGEATPSLLRKDSTTLALVAGRSPGREPGVLCLLAGEGTEAGVPGARRAPVSAGTGRGPLSGLLEPGWGFPPAASFTFFAST